MRLRYSIIIPTYKRPEKLGELLESLASQVDSYGEVIVVEQGVTHKNQIAPWLKRFSHSRYIHILESGTVNALRRGVTAAGGDILFFFDDDVLLESDAIASHLANYADPTIGSVVGRVVTEGHVLEPDKKNVGRVSFVGGFSDGYSSLIRQDIQVAIGCNWSMRKSVYEGVGGFDPEFWGIALRFEADMSVRIREAGHRIVFEPTAVVYHKRAESGGSRKSEGRLAWYRNFFSNETYFFFRHGRHALFPLFLLSRSGWALSCMFGFGREVSLRSLGTPFDGIIDGWSRYRRTDYRI